MWGNPFVEDLEKLCKLPRHVIEDIDDELNIPNPLHLFGVRKEINDLF